MRQRLLCGRLQEDGTQCRGEMVPQTTLFGEVVLWCGACGREERIIRHLARGPLGPAGASALPGQSPSDAKPTACVDCGNGNIHARGRCQSHYLMWWRQQQQHRRAAQGSTSLEPVVETAGGPDDGSDSSSGE